MLSPKKSVSKLLALVFAVLVILVMVVPLWRSGVTDELGNILFDSGATFYDAGVHLSLIGEMQSRFPPTNFAYAGVPLKNYHFSYDIILALIVKLTNVSYLDLYYRYAPIVLASLLALTIYLTAYRITKDKWLSTFAIFFTVFGSSLGVLTKVGHNNVFMTDQIYDMMINPQGVLCLVVFLSLFLFLSSYEKTKNKMWLLLFSLFLSLSFGIKAHGGVVFALGCCIAIAWALLKKDFKMAAFMSLGLGGMAVLIVLTMDQSVVGITFAPGWLLGKMMGDYERLYNLQFIELTKNALGANNWLRLVPLYLFAFIVYLGGSMGLRVFSLIEFIKKGITFKKLPTSEVFLYCSALASLLIPIFFNQGKKPYDIVQFTPYFTLLTGIFFTMFVFRLRRSLITGLLVLGFLLLANQEIAGRLKTINYDRGQVYMDETGIEKIGSQVAITPQINQAMSFIRTHTPPEAIFLIPPTKINLNTLWFTSFSWRRTVYSGEFFSYQVGLDTIGAKHNLEAIFGPNWVQPTFDYVYMRQNDLAKYGSIEDKYHLQRVYWNSEAIVFKRG